MNGKCSYSIGVGRTVHLATLSPTCTRSGLPPIVTIQSFDSNYNAVRDPLFCLCGTDDAVGHLLCRYLTPKLQTQNKDGAWGHLPCRSSDPKLQILNPKHR